MEFETFFVENDDVEVRAELHYHQGEKERVAHELQMLGRFGAWRIY